MEEAAEQLLSSLSPSLSLFLLRHDGGGEGKGQRRLINGRKESWRRQLERDKEKNKEDDDPGPPP
jgi:hypothetical protein